MTRIEVEVQEGDVKAVDSAVTVKQKERHPYTVMCESGVFKNGCLYAKGETVLLDNDTAARFKAVGDIA